MAFCRSSSCEDLHRIRVIGVCYFGALGIVTCSLYRKFQFEALLHIKRSITEGVGSIQPSTGDVA